MSRLAISYRHLYVVLRLPSDHPFQSALRAPFRYPIPSVGGLPLMPSREDAWNLLA